MCIFICMYTFICILIHIYISYVYMCVYIFIYIYIYIYVYVGVYVHTCSFSENNKNKQRNNERTFAHVCACVCQCQHVCGCVRVNECVRRYIQMNVQPRELRRRVRAQSAYSNMSTLKPTAPSPQPGRRTEYLLIHPSKSIELVNRQTRQICRLGLWNRC